MVTGFTTEDAIMKSMQITADDVYEQLKVAPDDIVNEAYDFVEFLINRRRQERTAEQTGRTLESFVGILKDSPSFDGDPQEIQRRMRDEWT